jgi:hypothetical protein
MKHFLRQSLLFLIPICIVAIVAEVMLRQVPNPYRYKYEWMEQHADSVETLVFGSSHTFYGIRPEYLEGRAFSLANVSQPWKLDIWLLKRWAERCKQLKTIIWPISFSSWFGSGRLEDGTESYRCRFYKIYMHCDLYPNFSKYNLELSDYRTAKGKLGTAVYNLFHDDADPGYDAYGWGKQYKLATKDMEKWNDGTEAAAAVKRHTVKSFEHTEKNIGLMTEVAEFCQQRGIRLVIITTPCWHAYTDSLNSTQLNRMYELTRQFQQKYHLTYLDYLKDPRFVPDDFFDSNHLSDVGAEKFSKILKEDLSQE